MSLLTCTRTPDLSGVLGRKVGASVVAGAVYMSAMSMSGLGMSWLSGHGLAALAPLQPHTPASQLRHLPRLWLSSLAYLVCYQPPP